MACYEVGGNRPRVHPSAYVHPLASLIGRVEVGPDCFIGPFASLRADFGAIRVGAGANVQDSCTVHGAPDGEVVLEEDAHLGHGCIIHNAFVGRNVLVGMNAVVLDGVVLGEGCVVGSCCVVPSGLAVPPGKLVVGVPGKIVGDVHSDLAAFKRVGTRWYQHLARRTRESFVEVPLEECCTQEPGGPWKPWIDAELDTLAEELGWRGRPWLGGGSIDKDIDTDEVDRRRRQAGQNDEGESEA
jgi:phenylacetic acid degradation protein